ncbi:preprotein translocase subunit SecA [Cytobacillus purgationiresistens]|uniref:Preprotein translocase subunit SecA n=1 Tax=Cytobacillus purgationiresistens TaxID=863449 RepID=A0ABU0ACZ2_9BACI|nr:accessory Sec system translocase SecA2 [Cytobacillus purgationiresistens]MDQ0269127.1 preprotein translocase subunit SecA [Cytobacillus purgationiresistens]
MTDVGATKVEAAFGVANLYEAGHQELRHYVMQSLRAHKVMRNDVDYIIKDGEVVIIDNFTGRMMEGRTFSEGLHQAIEAKEGLVISEENTTQATITVQNYFRMYNILSGMTESALPSKKEFEETYNLDVVTIPTNKPVQRVDMDDYVFVDQSSKMNKIVSEVKKMNDMGRPVLIGTTSIEQSETLAGVLKDNHIKHQLLNAKTEEGEANIIAKAGQKGQVMIGTNMAGRGTDITLGEGVKELGGLHIIGTQKHESSRIDMQLRGRSGRQGDPGSSQFIISIEDELFQYFEEEDKEKFMKKMKVDNEGVISASDSKKLVKQVQETVENMYHSSRNHLLKLDSVLDQQSRVIYSMRDRIIALPYNEALTEAAEYLYNYLKTAISDLNAHEEPNTAAFIEELSPLFANKKWVQEKFEGMDVKDIEELVFKESGSLKDRILNIEEYHLSEGRLKNLFLEQIDQNWIQYLDKMGLIRDGIQLRSYGQEDPYQIFEKEALESFKNLIVTIEYYTVQQLIELIENK